MTSPERIESLQRQWVSLLGSFGVMAASAYPVFDELLAAHAECHRHYHTLEHVGEVLRVVGRLAGLCTDVRPVLLAAWFHDAVYDARSRRNEEASSELAVARLSALGLQRDVVDHVSGLVIATAHVSPPVKSVTDAAVMLDADLAILGASEARYGRYAADIRQEYAHVPDIDYRTGRTRVLEGFLARDRIYRTPPMFAEGEAAARRNLRSELDRLAREADSGSILPPRNTL